MSGHDKALAKRDSDRLNSADGVARDIVRGLYEGRYVPGQRLVEPDLMAQYGVSRSTVREAIKRLVSDGVLVSHAFRGAQVRNLSRAEAKNLHAIMEVILGLAARQAAENPNEGERATIRESFEAIAGFREEMGWFEFAERRNRFFRALVRIAGNNELLRILPGIQVNLIRNILVSDPQERIEGYRKIADAVVAGDAKNAEKAARRHVARMASLTLPHFSD